jgi:hypothetical protein
MHGVKSATWCMNKGILLMLTHKANLQILFLSFSTYLQLNYALEI